jgi:hypothetical protein
MPKQAQKKNSLQNFAKKDPTTVGYTPWSKKNAQNEKLWNEAVTGYMEGITASTIARWLQNEHKCPLSTDHIRHALKEAKKREES